jgi:hypothetical protein
MWAVENLDPTATFGVIIKFHNVGPGSTPVCPTSYLTPTITLEPHQVNRLRCSIDYFNGCQCHASLVSGVLLQLPPWLN